MADANDKLDWEEERSEAAEEESAPSEASLLDALAGVL